MVQDIYDPLTEYVNVFRDRFKEVAHATFAELAKEAQVDVAANKETCSRLYGLEREVKAVKSSAGWWKVLQVLLWIVVLGSVIVFLATYEDMASRSSYGVYAAWGGVFVLSLILLFTLVNPKLKSLRESQNGLEEEISKLRKEAWKQMEPLNRLYDWDILTRMMTKTVPRLQFDPYFTTQRLADLQKVYGWDGSFNAERSVLYSHSGLINGNPFVICRTKKMLMGTKTYYGEKTIYWTTRERDSNGRYYTQHHSETLTATVTAPYPEYFDKTWLIYGNTAAPDLIFHRTKSGLASKEGSLSFKMARRKLRNKARDLAGSDFAMLTNEEFETAFDTSDRNNNQQFAMLFTPLAQESMMKLLKDGITGYGDDFDFDKNKMINTIIAVHMQDLDLDMSPDQYRNFDYEKAESDFYSINAEYFRAIYFAMAPLLCVPMYQQIRSQEDIYGRDMQMHSAFWEHEALANFWGVDRFKAPSCVTDCILKTEQVENNGDSSVIRVHAHGYRAEKRLSYVSKWGGDGNMHDVPVYWKEYFPVTGTGSFRIKEDNSGETDKAATQLERLQYIRNMLKADNMKVYRRHIASEA